ncbi:MAG: hypothetical protein QOD06_1750 [Candidatus Binatota bacterium]|jgi:hypothetical protein|nr:hypothetical protein [Candidatus Binatota bacterium]
MRRSFIRAALTFATVAALLPTTAAAIPVFARVYDKPCGTCHSVFPQLNPAGEDFRAHGFHGVRPAIGPLRVGNGIELPGIPPFAVYVGAGEDFTRERTPGEPSSTHARSNLAFLSLLAGGELGPHLAFLMDYELLEAEPDSGVLEVNSVPEQAYLQAHAEKLGWLGNLRVGWFELPLGISPRVHRLSATPYRTYTQSGCELLGTAPEGIECEDVPVPAESQIALEASGLHSATGFGWALGGTNGSNDRLDDRASRDLYLRLGEQLGFQKVGFFLQYSPDTYGNGPANRTLRFGPDVSLYTRRLRVLAQVLAGRESNPTAHSTELWYAGGFVEGEYRVTATILGLVRGESLFSPRFDDTRAGGAMKARHALWALTGGGQWLLLENLKLVAEVTYQEDREGVRDETTSEWFATFRAVTAFWAFGHPFDVRR